MSSLDQVAQRIEERFREMGGPFPGLEIKRLVANRDIQLDMHIDLDLYLSGVAGYSSGARRLDRRSLGELAKAQKFLAASFFEHYPQYGEYRTGITIAATPELYRHLMIAELNRLDLIQLVGDILIRCQSEAELEGHGV